jgi:hypothetical protein
VEFNFIIILRDNTAAEQAEQFRARTISGNIPDPITDWISCAVNANRLNLELTSFKDLPEIDEQPAESLFLDKMAYLIPQIYGNLHEEKVQEAALRELEKVQFQLTVIENPLTASPAHRPVGESFKSTADSYMGFIAFVGMENVRLDVRDTLEVRFLMLNGGDEDSSKSGNVQHQPELYVWSATVIDSTEFTPTGYLTIMLQRPSSPQSQHKSTVLPKPILAVNFQAASSTKDIERMITRGPTSKVKIRKPYDRNGYESQVRCADILWESSNDQKRRICQALLCHNPNRSPLKRVNLHALKGTSRLDLAEKFNPAQKKAYASLKDTPEITLLHGPFGTGKTTFLMSTAIEIISNPKTRNQILYVVESNLAVDDVAVRLSAMAKESGLGNKRIIRAHQLNSEQSEVFRCFKTQDAVPQGDQVSDQFLSEFANRAYFANLAKYHRDTHPSGDRRRVLVEMSLTQAMNNTLRTSCNPEIKALREKLEKCGKGRLPDKGSSSYTQMKSDLSKLMATTIREADIIVCTVAAAGQTDLATNFRPAVVYIDEAARILELKSLVPLANYNPAAFVFAADHMQMRPTVLSTMNPFRSQLLTSLFERLLSAGHEHSMLTVQHRCKGDIVPWVSDTFYQGKVTSPPLSDSELVKLNMVYHFVEQLGVSKPTNRYAVNIRHSSALRQNGGTSSYNDDEVDHIMEDVERIRKHPELKKMSICILSFYKAQVSKLKFECSNLSRVFVVDGNEHLPIPTPAAKTVDGAQGAEYDIVLVSFVQDRKIRFLAEPHRLLVALTRARWLLGIYANWRLVEENRQSTENWSIFELLGDLSAKGHVIHR